MATKKKTPAKAKDEKFIVLKCKDCGSEVSGSHKADVEATMDRHYRATGHSAAPAAPPVYTPPPPAYQPSTNTATTGFVPHEGPRY